MTVVPDISVVTGAPTTPVTVTAPAQSVPLPAGTFPVPAQSIRLASYRVKIDGQMRTVPARVTTTPAYSLPVPAGCAIAPPQTLSFNVVQTAPVVIPDPPPVVYPAPKGPLVFKSGETYRDCTIDGGTGNPAVRNAAGATNVLFERCRFRGGGGPAYTYVVLLGGGNDASHVTFTNCEIERNLGVETGSWGDKGYNDVGVLCSQSVKVTDIAFVGGTIGASNGIATGSPRMGIECYSDPNTVAGAGWQRVSFKDVVFEAADMETADFSDTPTARSDAPTFDGCTFKGGGVANTYYKNTLNFEMPTGAIVRGCTFLRGLGSWGYVLNCTDRDHKEYQGGGIVLDGNTFDLDTDNGIAAVDGGYPIVLRGSGHKVTNNVVKCHHGSNSFLTLDGAKGCPVSGNTGMTVAQINGASGNSIL